MPKRRRTTTRAAGANEATRGKRRGRQAEEEEDAGVDDGAEDGADDNVSEDAGEESDALEEDDQDDNEEQEEADDDDDDVGGVDGEQEESKEGEKFDLRTYFPGCGVNMFGEECIGLNSDLDGFERVLDKNPDAFIADDRVLGYVLCSVKPSPSYRLVRKVVERNPDALDGGDDFGMNSLNKYIKSQEWSECGEPEGEDYLAALEFLANARPHMCLEYGVNEVMEVQYVDLPLGQARHKGSFKVLATACPRAVPCLLYEMCNRACSNYARDEEKPYERDFVPVMEYALREAFLIQRRTLNVRILTCKTKFWIPKNLDQKFFRRWLSRHRDSIDKNDLRRQRIMAWPDYMASLEEPAGGYYWESFNFNFNMDACFDKDDKERGLTLLEACLGVADKRDVAFLIQCMHSVYHHETDITKKAPNKCMKEMVNRGWVDKTLLTKYRKKASATGGSK